MATFSKDVGDDRIHRDYLEFVRSADPNEIKAECARSGADGEAFWEEFAATREWLKRRGAIPSAEVGASGKGLKPDSLRSLAKEFGKSPKQIRRYCEAGLIPGAFRAPGGQWRVPPLSASKMEKLKKALGPNLRKTKDFYPAWKRAFLRSEPRREELSSAQLSLKEKGNIVHAAAELEKRGEKPTAKNIAMYLGKPRSYVYRVGGKQLLQSIRQEYLRATIGKYADYIEGQADRS